ncbi:MAG: energy-coupling factor transporter ATPase [Oscillospiraceae bacterium]|nr:energy-coupling factor transporter ATPase [Oscillospiraceae bacterium]
MCRGVVKINRVIQTDELTHKYSLGTPFESTAVDGLSFSVEKGEFIGIIGHTGSGKSTLIQHLNGLLKPTDGYVIINGRDIWSKKVNIKEIRFEVGLVFQYSEHQLFEETVFKDIAFGPKNMGLSQEEIEQRVLDAACAMGIDESWLSRSPFDLSGGEKRRVALAGVISMRPTVLILDEPAAGLDPQGRKTVLSKISQYHKSSGITVLLISHSMDDIVKYADKVLVMENGKLHSFETIEKVFSHSHNLEKIGLDLPQTTKIAMRLKEKGLDLGDGLYTVSKLAQKFLERIGKV